MQFEGDLDDLQRHWPKFVMMIAVSTLGIFVPLLRSAEKPWSATEAGYTMAKVLAASHEESSNSHVHTVRYQYAVKDESYAGEYTCDGCWAIEYARKGESLPIEYRRDDPARSRPSGAMTARKLTIWRSGAVIGALLLVAALVGFLSRLGNGRTAG